jgi:hypothetical protein
MTDHQAAPPPATPPTPAPTAPSAMSGMLASMSQAELLIAAGSLIIVAVDLVFGVLGDYGFSNIIWAAAAASLILILANGRAQRMSFSRQTYEGMLLVLAALALAMGVRELIADVVFIPGRNLGATFWLGFVGLYAGLAIMAFGAWRLWSART